MSDFTPDKGVSLPGLAYQNGASTVRMALSSIVAYAIGKGIIPADLHDEVIAVGVWLIPLGWAFYKNHNVTKAVKA